MKHILNLYEKQFFASLFIINYSQQRNFLISLETINDYLKHEVGIQKQFRTKQVFRLIYMNHSSYFIPSSIIPSSSRY